MDEFKLGAPALVCRWRLANKKLPLENRHLRALGERHVNGAPLSAPLVAWVKQHVEWTLEDGAYEYPDGVLMLVVDEDGKAAMSIGSYQELAHSAANDLLRRAQLARKEADETGVSPEDLWMVRGDALVWGKGADFAPSGANTLVRDLARTLGMPVRHDDDLLRDASVRGMAADEVFLVSDEHGVVPASDRSGARAQKFAVSYAKLLAAQQSKRGAR